MGRILRMISIVHNSGEFNIENLELFIRYKNITDLKWFVKNVVRIADNKREIKSILENEIIEFLSDTCNKDWHNKNDKRFIKKCNRLLEELEKI